MRLAICILALAMSAWAADPDTPQPADATPPAPPPKYDGFVFSGLADGYFTTNFNHPMGSANQFYNFDINNATSEMSLVKVTVDKSDKPFGFHVDAGFGETMRLIHAGDVAGQDHKALRYIEQMYLIAKPNHTHVTEFDFGQFVTSAGAEVIEANSNWNYSRSLLYALAIPYYHFGLRTSTPITKTWTVGLQVVNAWNTVWGNNDLKNVGVTSALTETKYTWSVNYYVGPNNPGTTSGQRNLVDTTLLLTPNGKINYYINGDYGQNNFAGGGSVNWYGVAGAATFHLTGKFALSPRAEVFDDHNGFMTGKAQAIKEGTITGEYKYNDHFLGRLEYRHDSSNTAFFDRGAQLAVVNGQNTLTLALLAVLGPLK